MSKVDIEVVCVFICIYIHIMNPVSVVRHIANIVDSLCAMRKAVQFISIGVTKVIATRSG